MHFNSERSVKSFNSHSPHRYAGSTVAATCLLIRSIWRVAELSDGFNGPLASMEGAFFALDSIPISIMSVLITVFHPKLWVGKRCDTRIV